MGVYSLWDLLKAVCSQIPIQDLSGKTLAIDASIWLVKANSVLSSNDQQKALSVLKCIFKKIIKLLHNNIRPIFVFDGQPPVIKRRTLQTRRRRRHFEKGSQLQVAKQAQIDLMRKIEGRAIVRKQEENQSRKRTPLSTNEIQQINKNFKQLLEKDQAQNAVRLAEKVKLQGEILTREYQFLVEIYPELLQKIGNVQVFDTFQLEMKINALAFIKEQAHTLKEATFISKKSQGQTKTKQQLQILRYLQINSKKEKIRHAQDKLYREGMVRKQQNGYQIIETMYNGKKLTQKRKIDAKRFSQREGAKMKNNISDLYQAQRDRQKQDDQDDYQFDQVNYQFKKKQKQIDFEDSQENGGFDFLDKVFNTDYVKDNQQKRQKSMHTGKNVSINSQERKSLNLNQIKESKFIVDEKIDFDDQFQIDKNMVNLLKKEGLERENNRKDSMPDFIYTSDLKDTFEYEQNQRTDLQNLLILLGVQFIFAKSQAQAQCANLQLLGIVDGIITEDSDVFLFGGRNVYRGVFQSDIKCYQGTKILDKIGMNRQKFILFALLLGSDYTDGVKGVGLVNAMEILKVFDTIQKMRNFSKWAKLADVLQIDSSLTTSEIIKYIESQCQNKQEVQQQKQFYLLHQKFKNYWQLDDKFPQQDVVDAYFHPQVHSQSDKKIQQLRLFLSQDRKEIDNSKSNQTIQKLMIEKFGMSQAQAKHNLKIINRKHRRQIQTQLNLNAQSDAIRELKSRRLKKALNVRQQQNNNDR